MFDRLTGKKALENHIHDLESQVEQIRQEKEALASRLTSKEETARRAVSSKQAVEEQLNAAANRIKTLEHEISKLEKDTSSELTFRNTSNLTKDSLDRFLYQISSIAAQEKTLVSIYLRPGDKCSHLEHAGELEQYLGPDKISLIEKIDSTTGTIVFYDTLRMVQEVIVPYLPVDKSCWQIDLRFNTGPAGELTNRNVNLCILLAHAGESFIGITSDPGVLLDHHIIRSSVMGKHTKGGWSQHRFERLRNEDVRHHAEKVKNALVTMVHESGIDIDFIVTAGESRLLSMILSDVNYPVITRGFDIPIEKRNIDRIMKDIWSSRRYEI